MTQCKGVTKSGARCKLPAGDSGYCHVHDPERRERKDVEAGIHAEAEGLRRQRLSQLRFSQRKGYVSVRSVLEREEMTADLRNSLWNVIHLRFFGYVGAPLAWTYAPPPMLVTIWVEVLKWPAHIVPTSAPEGIETLFKWYSAVAWYRVYDLIEFLLNHESDPELTASINRILERELSAYRFVGGVITDVSSEEEIAMLEEALDDDEFSGVTAHLRRALELLSDRQNPDYRNSIKESISAVESLVQSITGNPKATLGQALNVIECANSSIAIPKTLRKAYSALYGYTSNEDGIRHAMLEEPGLTASDAKYFLMVCTAFVNYLKAKLPA